MYYNIENRDGYNVITSIDGVVCYLIVGSEKAMLIDTGYGLGDLQVAVRTVTDKPLYIMNTHGHIDHVGGNGYFTETCYIHEADVELAKKHAGTEFRRSILELIRGFNENGQKIGAFPENFDEEHYLTMGTGKFATVKEGDVLELGNATIEIIETPGHTQGGISLWYREKNLVFFGDEAGPLVWLFAEESTSREVHIQSLEKLYNLNADGYLGAHSSEVRSRDDIMIYIQVAQEADNEKGIPDEGSPYESDRKPRICTLGGRDSMDTTQPGFAAIVISEDK